MQEVSNEIAKQLLDLLKVINDIENTNVKLELLKRVAEVNEKIQ